MNIDDVVEALENIHILMQKLIERLDTFEQKGGIGSGCTGHGCGRPLGHSGAHGSIKPRSGVRPSEVNPNRNEIEYTEQPSSDNRPRAGVRPERSKPKA